MKITDHWTEDYIIVDKKKTYRRDVRGYWYKYCFANGLTDRPSGWREIKEKSISFSLEKLLKKRVE